jgi:hypothetical protein
MNLPSVIRGCVALVLLLGAEAVLAAAPSVPPSGLWDGIVVVNDVEIPFRFALRVQRGQAEGSFFNGEAHGIGSPRSLNRLSLVAACASLRDPEHSERVRRLVATERAEWHRLLDALQLRHTQACASFVYFQGPPQSELALALAEAGIQIGRSFAPFGDWTRISIGLPSENRRVQSALRKLLTSHGSEVRAPRGEP